MFADIFSILVRSILVSLYVCQGVFHLVGIAGIEVVGRFVSQFLIFVFVVFFAHVFFRVSMGQKYAFSSKQRLNILPE